MKRKSLTCKMMLDLDARLNKISFEELPKIYNQLNKFIWPVELGEQPTAFYDSAEVSYILQEIKNRCGNKAIWRYRKTKEEGYTPQMFEDWWDSTFIGGEPSYELYKRLREKNCRKQSQKRKNYADSVLNFLFGCLFTSFLFLLKSICT